MTFIPKTSMYTKASFLVIAVIEILMQTVHFKLAGMFLGVSMLAGIAYAYHAKISKVFMIAWIIGFAPFVVFMRPFIFAESGFTIITLLLGILVFFNMRKELERILTNRNISFIIAFFTLYVLVGLILGTKLTHFVKIIELCTTLVLISILLYYPQYRSFAFRNFVYSSIAIYIVMIPNISDRLAVQTEAGFSIGGDPSGMAALLVISLIFVFFDNGKMIQLSQRSKYLLLLTGTTFVFLLLSTSRTNIASMFSVLLVYAFTNVSNVLKYSVVIISVLTIGLTLLDSKYFDTLEKFYVKKLDVKEKSLNQLTTNRFIQWQVAFHYFDTASLPDLLLGYGPGKKSFVHEKGAEYIRDFGYIDGATSAFHLHTLYLVIAVEFGFIAFFAFMFVLFRALYKNFKLFLHKKEILMYFTIAYMFTIAANAGVSVLGGMYMAFIFASPRIFDDRYLKYDEKMSL